MRKSVNSAVPIQVPLVVKKPLMIILSVIAVVSVLSLSAAIALAVWLDPNDYKPQMIALVKEKTGRDLVIHGDIGLSFFPKFGLSTGKLELKNRPEFSDGPFAVVERGEIQVQWWPILARKIRIDRIVLKGMHLYLTTNPLGQSNWAYQASTGSVAAEAGTGKNQEDSSLNPLAVSTAAAAAISKISIEDAQIHWENQQIGKRYDLEQLNLKTGKWAVGRPVDVELSFRLMDSGAKSIADVRSSTRLTLSRHFETVELTEPVVVYSLLAAPLTGTMPPLELKADRILFNQKARQLATKGTRIDFGDLHAGIELTGNHIPETPEFQWSVAVTEFNPAGFLQRMNVHLPVVQGNKKALSRFSMRSDGMATAEGVTVQQFSGRLDETQFKGSARIDNFSNPSIVFKGHLDAVNANRYLPAKAKADKSWATPAVAVAAALATIPPDLLKSLRVDGDLLLDRLQFNGLSAQGIQLKINSDQGRISAEQTVSKLYQGSYRGKADLTMGDKGPTALSAQEQINNLSLEPLLKDGYGKARIRGTLKASTHWESVAGNAKNLMSAVRGQLKFKVKEGAITGFDLQRFIENLTKGASKADSQENKQTLFSVMSGSASLANGILSSQDFLVQSALFRVDGHGNVNLKTEALDCKLKTQWIKKAATASEPEQFHSTPVVVKVAGSFDKPVYSLDVAALLTEKNKAKIEKLIGKNKNKINKFLDKLDKKLGPDSGELLKNFF